MGSVLRILGYVLILAGGVLGLAEIVAFVVGGASSGRTISALWIEVHPGSLIGLQNMVQDGLGREGWGPSVWHPIALVLRLPAWAAFVVPGIALAFLNRERDEQPA
jgi:hypothetical protein